MDILLISPTSHGIGGISQHIQGLSAFLEKEGNHVKIISSENTFTIPIKGIMNPSFMVSSFLKSFAKRWDIVHAHNLPSALAMRNASGKRILTVHGIYSEQVKLLHKKSVSKIADVYQNKALNWADAITAVSKEAADYYQKMGYGVHHIPNAIDVSSLGTKTDRRFDKQVVYVGRLSFEKGIDTLVQIATKLDEDVHLLVIGTGPEVEKIKKIRQKNVHYLGYLPKEDTIALIRGSDVLIQPSIVEGISSTILEAMACKTLVVATNIGGNGEILSNYKTGILVDPNDAVSQISDTISEFYSDKNKFSDIVESSFEEVKRRYDWSVVGEQYLKLYHKLLS